MRDDFGILIMSYGRPDNVKTLQSLFKSNYTGKWFIVIGDDDPKMEGYKATFGDKCIVFNKADYIAKTDRMGLKITKVIMFARNACFDIAENLGLKYFQQFDDDYTGFFMPFDDKMEYRGAKHRIKNYDRVADTMLEFFERTPANCKAVAFAQGGDFIGGIGPGWGISSVRKCMNSWFCSVDRRFPFRGVMNEDVNAYTYEQSIGGLCFNVRQYSLNQPLTQTTGGMTAIYKQYGTHVKSFLSVMLNPSFCRIGVMGQSMSRIHHAINWNRCAAKIIRENHKKHNENQNNNAMA